MTAATKAEFPIDHEKLSTDSSTREGPARNLRLASAPEFEWQIECVSGAEGRELRAQQAAAIKELMEWLRVSRITSTRAG